MIADIELYDLEAGLAFCDGAIHGLAQLAGPGDKPVYGVAIFVQKVVDLFGGTHDLSPSDAPIDAPSTVPLLVVILSREEVIWHVEGLSLFPKCEQILVWKQRL